MIDDILYIDYQTVFYKCNNLVFQIKTYCDFQKETYESKENLVFLGMMGSGKSSIGSLVARK